MKSFSINVGKRGRTKVNLDALVLVETRMLVCTNSGGGKSWMLRVLAEQLAPKIPTIVFDPEGEFVTLREGVDAVIVAQDGGDVRTDPKSAKLLARKLLEMRLSAVIDLSDLNRAQKQDYLSRFLESMMTAPKSLWQPIIVMIDEAHIFAPERSSGRAQSLDWVVTLLSQGRKRGFCPIVATQRLSKLHKDVAAECNNLMIGRTTLDLDLRRACDLMQKGKAAWRTFQGLEPGMFFAFGPAFSERGVIELKSAQVRTTHPKSGHRHTLEPPAPSDRIRKVLTEFEGLPEQAAEEARTLEEAQKEIAKLRRELRKSAKPTAAPSADPALRESLRAAEREAKESARNYQRLEERHQQLLARLGKRLGAIGTQIQQTSAMLGHPVSDHPKERPAPRRHPAAVVPKAPTNGAPPRSNGLSTPQQRVLDGLAWLEAAEIGEPTRTQVAFASGYSPSSGGFQNLLGTLRTDGLVDYPLRGSVSLTDAGRAAANLQGTPSTQEFLEQVYAKLSKPQARVLRVAVEVWPEDISREDLADRSGYSPSSGGFQNLVGSLRTLSVVDYPARGRVKATPILFLD